MHQLSISSLSSISGGDYSACQRLPAAAVATISPVLNKPHDLAPTADGYDETSTCCKQHCHQPVLPKNGDRNSIGQIYSWGTWWDDSH